MNPLDPLLRKALFALAGVLIIGLLVVQLQSTQAKLAEARTSAEAVCVQVRQLSGNPKMNCKDVGPQLTAAIDDQSKLVVALEKQSSLVRQLAAQTKDQQDKADKAARSATQRVDGIAATRERLQRSIARPGASCEASAALKEAWQ